MLVAIALASLTAAAVAGTSVGAQFFEAAIPIRPNVPYDGQFTFVRLRYGPRVAFASQRIPWTHDYPLGEQHFMQIMNEISYLRPKITESQVMALDDPDLPRYPIAYMSEPGYLVLTEDEAVGFRNYLLKGGFVIFDDFALERGGWDYFERVFQQVIPGARWYELDGSHAIFHSFFEIPEPLKFAPPYGHEEPPQYMGLFEDNDPEKRLMAIVNYNNDISEYWEFSNTGFAPISESNEAFKLGVNYVIYAMTH